MKIFIGNIGIHITSEELFLLFSRFGKVTWAEVPRNKNNMALGYGYVRMPVCTDGHNAIIALNKKQFKEQYLSVCEALHSSSLSKEPAYG